MTVGPHPLHMWFWLKRAKKTFPSLPYFHSCTTLEVFSFAVQDLLEAFSILLFLRFPSRSILARFK